MHQAISRATLVFACLLPFPIYSHSYIHALELFSPRVIQYLFTKHSCLMVSHMKTLGMLQNHYMHQLHEAVLTTEKSMYFKHAHMHTQHDGGIDVGQAEDLIKAFNWMPLPPNFNANLEGLEELAEEELDEELEKIGFLRPTLEGDGLNATIPMEEVFDTSNLDSMQGRQHTTHYQQGTQSEH